MRKTAFGLLLWMATAMAIAETRPLVWKDQIGGGFVKNTYFVGMKIDGGLGLTIFGTSLRHDLVFWDLNGGWIFTGVLADNHWYRGNVELRGELFDGSQVNQHRAYLVGGTALLRYDFATRTRWIPFFEIGGGPSATDIGKPDLGSTFEFNLQSGLGAYYFINPHFAVSAECRLLHLSNAEIKSPDRGVNALLFEAGITWFF